MYKDGVSDREKLEMVANEQSYTGTDPDANRFVGLDEFHCANIRKEQRLYAFKPAFFYDKLSREKTETVDFCWFFDQATFDRLVKGGKFNSREVAEYLQVDYWKNPRMPNSDAVYNDSILAFELKEDIRVPVGVCLANDQFGNGGASECYIPKDMVKQLQEDGLLVFDKDASMIHKGTNTIIHDTRAKQIDEAVDQKMKFCKDNNQKHCTIPNFAIPADPHNNIPSAPFDCDHVGKDSTYDAIKLEKIDLSKPITGSVAGDHYVKANEISTNKIVENEPVIDRNEDNIPIKESKHLMVNTSSGMPEAEDVKNPLAGVYDLQKYFDRPEDAEHSEEAVFSNELDYW